MMFTYLDQMIEKGRAEGHVEGKAEGKVEGKVEERENIISRMLTMNPLDTVVKVGGFSYDEVKRIYDNMIREDQTPYRL